MTNKTLTVGNPTSSLDIFLSANSIPVSGRYVGFQLFDAIDAQVVSGIALNPALGHYTGSGIIPAGYQLGEWDIRWTIITQGGGLQFAAEEFNVVDTEIAIGFVPAEDETGTIYEAVLLDIGDPEGAIFNDDLLKRTLIKAIRRLNRKLGLNHTQCCGSRFGRHSCCHIGPITVDIESGNVFPDDNDLIDLLILQMEVIILDSEISALKRLHASGPFGQTRINGDGISVTNPDGTVVSVSPSRLSFRSDLHKFDLQQKQKELEQSINLYKYQKSACWGKYIWW